MEKHTLIVFLALSIAGLAYTEVCYVGRDFDTVSQSFSWVLPVPNPCQCTALRLGGDIVSPTRRMSFYHIKQLYLSENADDIWTAFNCTAAACAKLSGNWKPFGHHCYLIDNRKVNYPDATEYCQELSKPGRSAHLASINSKEENAFLQRYNAAAVTSDSIGLWIGYDRIYTDGFVWADGTKNGFEDWNAGEPSGGVEKCAMLWYGIHWNDLACYLSLHEFICKISAK